MPTDEVIKGATYLHDADSVLYKVDTLPENATGYEVTQQLGQAMVYYTQLQDGETRPAGTPYVREMNDFMQNFTRVTT